MRRKKSAIRLFSGLLYKLCLLGCFVSPELQSQSIPKEAERIMTELKPFCSVKLDEDDDVVEFSCSNLCSDTLLQFNRRKDWRFGYQIGADVFEKVDSFPFSDEVYFFLERTLLKVFLIKHNRKILDELSSDRISIEVNGVNLVQIPEINCGKISSIIASDVGFSISKDSNMFTAGWLDIHNNTIKITFPSSYELIAGLDKKELDEMLSTHLDSLKVIDTINMTSEFEDRRLIEYMDSLFILEGESISDGISSNVYLHIKDKKHVILKSMNYPVETFANMVQFPELATGLELTLSQFCYGDTIRIHKIQFFDLLKWFDKDFVRYSGFEKEGKDTIRTTIYLKNKYYNFAHLIVVEYKKNDIFNESSILDAKMYGFIRSDNFRGIKLGAPKKEFRYQLALPE